ncbi:hypothetical protein [Streptomyces sp. CB01881]|uniref:hypothetical protein n=1 Tax=Streptomyces sp. CB01881 TaxID=2078691 RepID=UPI000CDCAFB9|nr:hypothetical protein [Streptomyces sp. CB01881]AUY51520.1 hypothetical protein C2142_24165 [Streptomyces sp. CB01881]TYC74911.1 hypothetical protein EH183_24155 [Streptomyces sp. CB01881]
MNDHTDPEHTDPTEVRLTAELAALADAPAPAARMDTAWALRAGRSRLRRRRLGVLGAAAAVALGATLLSATLPGGHPGQVAAAPAASPTAAPSALPPLGPDTGRSPLPTGASFGWLPEGFNEAAYNLGFSGQPDASQVKVFGPQQTGPNALASNRQLIFLTLFAPGEVPTVGTTPTGQQLYRVDAAPVNGRPAYWVGTGPDNPAGPGNDRTLRWQTADGRWAQLHGSYMSDADDVLNKLHRVAEGVKVAPQAVPLPFRIHDVPAGFTPSGASFYYGPEASVGYPWSASVNYNSGGDQIAVSVQPDVTPVTGWWDSPLQAGATQQQQPTCVVASGLKLCATSFQGEAPFASVGGFAGWLGHFTSLGTDPAAWTTEVLG